jgi:lysophospholipid acyltransferase (LPLAT)-like uncharacterized protein
MAKGVRIRFSAQLAQMAAFLLRVYMRLVWATSRFDIVNAPARDRELRERPGGILTGWHGRLILLMYDSKSPLNTALFASRSADGQIVVDMMSRWKLDEIRGSSATRGKDKGGREALRAGISYLTEQPGRYITMTPDGPRGPNGIAKPGVALIAARTGKHVLPVGYSCSMGIDFMSSWDRFLLPLPFCRYVIVWGDPVPPPTERGPEVTEAFRQRIETALLTAQQEADRRAKRRHPFLQDPEEHAA